MTYPVSSRSGCSVQGNVFQQDGSLLFAANEILYLLHEHFGDISFHIASINFFGMDGLGHHILLTSTLAVTFYWGI
jgi:hypothetical protein